MSEPENNSPKKEQGLFQKYFFLVIDILGQKAILQTLTELPTSEEEKVDFLRKVSQTLVRVEYIRNNFKTIFDSQKKHEPNVNLVSKELWDEFAAARKSEVICYGFSDSIIIAVPLMGNDDNCTAMNGVSSALHAVAAINLVALRRKIPLRGGLDVGLGSLIGPSEIYGSALARAYEIEKNLAEYPRCVVGNEFFQYLYWVESQPIINIRGKVAQEWARRCRGMIIQDSDGRHMVDFMGGWVKETFGTNFSSADIKTAIEFVKSEYEKHLASSNHKLSSRYFRLLNYMMRRSKIWED